jgi:hypothetical protein
MMQLQFAQVLQTLSSIFEYSPNETIKVLLEIPVLIPREPAKRVIDIALLHTVEGTKTYYPIELKCFRLYTRDGSRNKRGAQNIGMYDYWADIENVEQYALMPGYAFGTQLTLTDDPYYVSGRHTGEQVSVYGTSRARHAVTGVLNHPIPNRKGLITLLGTYTMQHWYTIAGFHFIKQQTQLLK